MILNHITTAEMVKKLLHIIDKRVDKSKEKIIAQKRNLETTL
jgi:hypothetical protein